MAPRCPTLAMLGVVAMLAACATTSTRAPTEDGLTYLAGLTSEYSVRLDELRSRTGQSNRLPQAVIGGDKTFTIAASLFRKEPYLGLEMVIQNQTEETLVLGRDDVQLFDNAGKRLAPVSDFPGAADLGLRSKVRARRDYATHTPSGTTSTGSIPRNSSDASELRKSVSRPLKVDMGPEQRAPDFVWMGDLTDTESAAAPLTLAVGAKENRPYWAYWRVSPEVEYPLTAIITVNNKRVLMMFDS